MKNIGIIGAGQLGSRHLQALARVEEKLAIYVADVNEESLDTARKRYEEVAQKSCHEVGYFSSISSFPEFMDVVVIATSSFIRAAMIKELLKDRQVKHLILEKFLFPRLSDYDLTADLMKARSDMNVWVNCPRRIFEVYKSIAEEAKDTFPLNVSVVGADWGLGCNSVHFTDLFSFLTGGSEVFIINESLSNNYTESRRQGYIEFSGSLYFGTDRGDKMEITSFGYGEHPIIVKVSSPFACWIVKEGTRECEYAGKGAWKFSDKIVEFPMQSEMTGEIVHNLIATNTCGLTPYSASEELHKTLLRIFVEKYNCINKTDGDLCPIT